MRKILAALAIAGVFGVTALVAVPAQAGVGRAIARVADGGHRHHGHHHVVFNRHRRDHG